MVTEVSAPEHPAQVCIVYSFYYVLFISLTCTFCLKCKKWKKKNKGLGSEQIDVMASTSASDPDGSLVVDLTLSDEDTIELPSGFPSIEVLDTDNCQRVRFLDEIPAEVLDAYLRHFYSGERGISPVVRMWCIKKFYELNPGAPYFDFDFI